MHGVSRVQNNPTMAALYPPVRPTFIRQVSRRQKTDCKLTTKDTRGFGFGDPEIKKSFLPEVDEEWTAILKCDWTKCV